MSIKFSIKVMLIEFFASHSEYYCEYKIKIFSCVTLNFCELWLQQSNLHFTRLSIYRSNFESKIFKPYKFISWNRSFSQFSVRNWILISILWTKTTMNTKIQTRICIYCVICIISLLLIIWNLIEKIMIITNS